MEFQEALAQVAEIREDLARTELFRGYRSLTVGLSGVVGIAAALLQGIVAPQPSQELGAYLLLWASAAAINLILVGSEMWLRACQAPAAIARQKTIFAMEQFAPAVVVGGLLTLVIARCAAESAWMLPGLWSLVFSLGIFASCRLLPRAVFTVGIWYLLWGIVALAAGQGVGAFSGWTMGAAFGGGQLLLSAVLYLTLERGHSVEEAV